MKLDLPAPPGVERPPEAVFRGLLLGRAPPALGTPLLVVKGRERPPSPRKGLAAPDRGSESGDSEAERLGRGRSEYGRGALGRPEPARLEPGRLEPEPVALKRGPLKRAGLGRSDGISSM